MNSKLYTLSAALVLILAAGGTQAATSAPHAKLHLAESSVGSTAYLGTIRVTPASASVARTAYLGSITVTPADGASARYATRSSTVYLGTVEVRAADTRMASNNTPVPSSAYLGTITVRSNRATTLAAASIPSRAYSARNIIKMLHTLVFGR